jgi:tryptophan halogenase
MVDAAVKNIVIVGGGTAGWMTAAALSKLLGSGQSIRLIESDDIGIIGVGEATIPHLHEFNLALGIDEDEFVKATQGSFKLGIEFVNWGSLGSRYIHGFGKVGNATDGLPFYHFWLRMQRLNKAKSLEAYSINTQAPKDFKFMRPRADMAGSPLADIAYAFHFDAGLYAKFLRAFAEKRGAVRTEGKVKNVTLRSEDGYIQSVTMESGETIEGDLFIDCSGMRALLIEQTLNAGFENWSHWLPCDRAVAMPCASAGELLPMTRSTAHTAGWQWRIPLQHRTGNGHVYSSAYMSEQEATDLLVQNLDGKPLADPRPLKFVTGRRNNFWVKNCVAIGLSSGFLEPLESTSIHLIHTAISRLINFFPRMGFDAADIAEYNRLTVWEYEKIRDFLILHYKQTERTDSDFWNYCRTMSVPESLKNKMDLFASNGRIYRDGQELFAEVSWLQVMVGQHLMPKAHHPLADLRSEQEVAAYVDNVQRVVGKCVEAMPKQADFIAAHCAATAQ